MRAVDARVQDRNLRGSADADLTVDVLPADLRERPLVAVVGVVRRSTGLARAVRLDAGHARVRAQLVERGLEACAAREQDAMDAERSDVVRAHGSRRREDLRLRIGRRTSREPDEVRLGRRAESGGERRRGAPVGGIGGRGGELCGEAVRKIERVGDRPVGGDGDVGGVVPRVAPVVVHGEVHGVAGLPVGAGKGHGVAGGVRLLVAVQGRCSRRRRYGRERRRGAPVGGIGGRGRELCGEAVRKIEGVRDRPVGGDGDVGGVVPRVAPVVVHGDVHGVAGPPVGAGKGRRCRRGRTSPRRCPGSVSRSAQEEVGSVP